MVINNFSNFFKRIFSKVTDDRSIGKTLLLSILFFSALMTIVLTLIQLIIDYRLEVDTLNTRLNEIEKSYKNSIEASLWDVDRDQLEIQLEGIMRLPDIQQVIVKENEEVETAIYIEKGESGDLMLERQYDLYHSTGQQDPIHIGFLYVQASLAGVYSRLFNKALTIVLIQGIKTFFVSFFILFVFYRLVTRHIIAIEDFVKKIDLSGKLPTLELDRRKKNINDELDNLVNAYNVMAKDLELAYNDIRTVNDRLKEDIVARKRAEAEVHMLNEELEYRVQVRTSELEVANKELNAFCYSVSHDLRAPLRRVYGFQRNIVSECSHKLDQQGLHYLARMEACIQEMNAMIDSFLTLSKSTSTELELASVDLSKVVQHSLQQLEERDPHRRVTLERQERIITHCDARLVELLINNLIDNAWKYTVKSEEAKIMFYREKHGRETVYIIEDNGVGFDMEFASHLFAPFVRLHKLSDFQGIGIGLAIVKRVVARHGGRVWVESEPDKGAKFFFTLKAKGA